MTAVLAWFFFCLFYLVQALVRESAAWARLKQRFTLWRQARQDLRFATPERKLEIEVFLGVLEAVLEDRGFRCDVVCALAIEERALRSVHIIASMPKDVALAVMRQVEFACDRIEQDREAARR
jgi:hypothetical protein